MIMNLYGRMFLRQTQSGSDNFEEKCTRYRFGTELYKDINFSIKRPWLTKSQKFNFLMLQDNSIHWFSPDHNFGRHSRA